jgi:hypothetical protein
MQRLGLPHFEKNKKEAFSQFEYLEEVCLLTSQAIEGGNNDSWSYIWGSTTFTSKHALVGTGPPVPARKGL